MLKLSVHQFVSHLPIEQQGAVLVNKEAFLAFLRDEFCGCEVTKRALVEAATVYAKREQVMVSCLAEERHAAKAVIFAYMRLGDELLRRGKVEKPQSHFRVYRRKTQARAKPPAKDTRFKTVEVFINGRKERLEQYPSDITWQETEQFQRSDLYRMPEVGLEPEVVETSKTAHFESASRPTGWGWLTLDGEVVERVRCF